MEVYEDCKVINITNEELGFKKKNPKSVAFILRVDNWKLLEHNMFYFQLYKVRRRNKEGDASTSALYADGSYYCKGYSNWTFYEHEDEYDHGKQHEVEVGLKLHSWNDMYLHKKVLQKVYEIASGHVGAEADQEEEVENE